MTQNAIPPNFVILAAHTLLVQLTSKFRPALGNMNSRKVQRYEERGVHDSQVDYETPNMI